MEQDCCRICLSKTQSLERQDLFMEGFNNLSVLGQLYEEVLSIPISNGKITLRYICSNCSLQLKLFKQLKTKALETLMFLMNLFNTSHYKDDNRVENEHEEIKPFEINVQTDNDPDTLDYNQLRNEYDFENEENPSIAEYIDCEDNDQETNTTENKISENGISESEIIENCLDENAFAKNSYEIKDDDNNMLVQIEEQEEYENVDSVEEFIEDEEKISLDTSDEEEYEICYLDDEDAIVEKPEKEIEQNQYDDECLLEEEDINKIKPNSIEETEVLCCSECDETFKHKSQLKNHKKKMHYITRKIQCPLCNKALFSEDTYQAHINVHNGLPAYQCNICEKAFNQKVHYNYHMLNHNNERNIICDVCQKRFISTGDLKTHMRCHTDERRYKCDICDKRFRAHTHMVNHRYSHFEKQFECPSCFQKYMSPNTLRTHFKDVHSAEVPFKCTFCEKRFKRKHHLQAHYKTHTKVMGSSR